ncbi:hypothetical protein PV10_08162 [Exophiala mesophila]|uniref:Extracellular membrane protein CFEM domain-containing protein n=1 Tax=Exophiala mesophila TaxID=212818 RepID=A0A0D1Z3L9_EXOME|nr:uncharacterized protein PV10_08162 [Exophiala mesophila]KIV88479.1 hypothetical protein PV10_08162 [Exophiala mesophila]
MKTTLLFSTLALAVRVFAAVPPACLLNAVNTQDLPGDLDAVCGDDALEIQEAIASLCTGDNVSIAQSAFISTCSVAGSSVAPYTATATATNSATATGSGSSTATTGASGSGGSSASSTNSAGGSSATDNAAADPKKQVGSFAAAAIAIAGVVFVL